MTPFGGDGRLPGDCGVWLGSEFVLFVEAEFAPLYAGGIGCCAVPLGGGGCGPGELCGAVGGWDGWSSSSAMPGAFGLGGVGPP